LYPEIILTESLHLSTYHLFLTLLPCGVVFWIIQFAKKQNLNIRVALDLYLISILSGWLGARVLHILYERPDYYLKNPLKVFYLSEGGFVFFGGLLAGFLANYLYCKKNNEDFEQWGDFFAPIYAVTYGVGRLACLLAGCCYGKACDLPWGLELIEGEHLHRHPTPLYTTLWEISLGLLLFYLNKKYPHKKKDSLKKGDLKKRDLKKGSLLGIWIFMHGLGRFIIEFWRDDFRGPLLATLSLGQWISIALMIISGIYLFKKKPLLL
jgi:phosphatidylglycerol:prolipoprotein diacylglycerol transferase